MRRWGSVLLGVVFFFSLGLPVASARHRRLPPPLEKHVCGDTVSHSFRLDNDLTGCPGNGLNVNTSNVVVDLNGHRILGSNTSGVGIQTSPSKTNITVENGLISGFTIFGVLTFSDDSTIRNLLVTDTGPLNTGISVQGNGTTVEDNTVTRNPIGISVQFGLAQTHGSTVRRNTVVGNGTGIDVDDSDGNSVTGNTVSGNAEVGIRVDKIGATNTSDGNIVHGNTVVGNGTSGIFIVKATNTRVTGNTVRGNDSDGISGIQVSGTEIGDGTPAGANTANANEGNGISLTGGTGANSVEMNTTKGNLADGIYDDTAGETITSNTTNENGTNGIFLVGTPATFANNVANTNGYKNGVDANGGYGIVAPGTTDTTNSAANNSTAGQCNPSSACTSGGKTAPPLIACDQQISATATFSYPMDCPGLVLSIFNASGTTVDLGDHYFKADATDGGVNISGGTDITLRGGVIESVDDAAVEVNGATRVKVLNLVSTGSSVGIIFVSPTASSTISGAIVSRSTTAGMEVAGQRNSISSSRVIGTDGVGVDLRKDVIPAAALSLVGSTVMGGTGDGVDLHDVQQSVVTRSIIVGNGADGIQLRAGDSGSKGNTIARNLIRGNDGVGILDASDGTQLADGIGDARNRFVKNVVTENRSNGIEIDTDPDSTHVLIKKNTVADNGGDAGIYIQSELAHLRLLQNTSSNNAFDGIDVDNTARGMNVSNNKTFHNGFLNNNTDPDTGLGILAPSGIHGCGNRSKRNEDVDQILPKKLKRPC